MAAVAPGSPNAMDEILRDFGQIVVDDVRDVLHVNAAGGQVSGYEDAEAPLLETGERCGALRLRAVAMDHGGREAFAIQAFGNALSAALGAREH